MTSFRIGIPPRDKRIGRFITRVQEEIRRAFVEESERTGLTQQMLADKLGMDKGALSRRLNGQSNLTLATIAELAHGLDRVPEISFVRTVPPPGENYIVSRPDDVVTGKAVIGATDVIFATGTTGPALKIYQSEAPHAEG